jgi:hypothetical protein
MGQFLPWWEGQSWSALPQLSDVDLLGDSQGIIHLYAEISNCALDFSVTKKQLHCSQIAGATVDQRSLGAPKRVRAEFAAIQSDTVDPTPLANRGSIRRVAIWSNVFDFQHDEIATAKLAIDSKIKHCEITDSPLGFKPTPDRPHVLWRQRWLGTRWFPFVPGLALAGCR